MTASAPRYDPRVLVQVRALDDRREPIAEICRRVNSVLDELGVTRVSYVHLRRLVREHRKEQDLRREKVLETLEIAAEVSIATLEHRVADPYVIVPRVRERRRSKT